MFVPSHFWTSDDVDNAAIQRRAGAAKSFHRLCQKSGNFHILRPRTHPVHRLERNFAWPSGPGHVPLGHAKFHVNRYESPLRGEYADFRLLSKNNTGSLPLRIPAGKTKQTPFFRTYSWRAFFDLPKLCMVIEDVESITKRCQSFFDPTHTFSYRVHGKIRGK